MPAASAFFGNYIDHASESVASEAYRYHSLVHLDPLSEIDRQIVDVQCSPGTFLRYSVDEDLHMLAGETVQTQLCVRAYAARFTQFQSRKL